MRMVLEQWEVAVSPNCVLYSTLPPPDPSLPSPSSRNRHHRRGFRVWGVVVRHGQQIAFEAALLQVNLAEIELLLFSLLSSSFRTHC